MKKIIALCLTGVMVFGTMSIHADNKTVTNSPYGLAPINDEKTIEMLKKSGQIANNATYEEAMKIVAEIVREREQGFNEKGELDQKSNRVAQIKLEKATTSSNLFNGNGNKLGKTTRNLAPVQQEQYDGTVRTDKVLALLIEFPDFTADQIQPEDSDMFYDKYETGHYSDMLFSSTGYAGPNGENLISMKQYYEQQSGGSYSVNGLVAGWYKAPQPAAYYGGTSPSGNHDSRARSLVAAALKAAVAENKVNLAEFDQEDRYDLDGDGNLREPDGIIDHLMIFHSSVGEEAGGGQLGTNAIWSHRWNLGGIYTLPGTTSASPRWGGQMAAYDYTMMPADGAAGVSAHEYGHDLGLPDEYDTIYSGKGEPVSYWSIMSSGSWVGKIPGTEPTGFSPWAKQYFQANMGGNWLKGSEITLNDLNKGNLTFTLDQASSKGTNNDVVKVSLPDKETRILTAASGDLMYFSQSGNNVHTSMSSVVDLTKATNATLSFNVNYAIEADYDAAFVYVQTSKGRFALQGNVTTNVTLQDNLNTAYNWPIGSHYITGESNGWVGATFDLSAYKGEIVTIGVEYLTDSGAVMAGLYMDDISVTVDGVAVINDSVDNNTAFTLNGFTKDNGVIKTPHYYLLEWRNHAGVDAGLASISRGDGFMQFEEGLLVWYADDFYDNNHVGVHPGNGFLGVVDADQNEIVWDNGDVASSKYQIHDATFSLLKNDKMAFNYPEFGLKDYKAKFNTEFDDSLSFVNPLIPDAGRAITTYGLKIKVVGESRDRSVGQIVIGK